jgi:hypothetical protein
LTLEEPGTPSEESEISMYFSCFSYLPIDFLFDSSSRLLAGCFFFLSFGDSVSCRITYIDVIFCCSRDGGAARREPCIDGLASTALAVLLRRKLIVFLFLNYSFTCISFSAPFSLRAPIFESPLSALASLFSSRASRQEFMVSMGSLLSSFLCCLFSHKKKSERRRGN